MTFKDASGGQSNPPAQGPQVDKGVTHFFSDAIVKTPVYQRPSK